MAFMDFYNDAIGGLPRIGRKKMKGLVAMINTSQRAMRFSHRPDLAARHAKIVVAQMQRAVIRYSPSDPRRLPQ